MSPTHHRLCQHPDRVQVALSRADCSFCSVLDRAAVIPDPVFDAAARTLMTDCSLSADAASAVLVDVLADLGLRRA